MRIIRLATAAVCATACVLSGAVPAVAQGKAVTRASTSQGARPLTSPKPPAGYVMVNSASISAPGGLQTAGFVTCPGTTVPLGGGVNISGSDDLYNNINSSYPSGGNWVADVNIGGPATTFSVYAICANKPAGYHQVASATVDNPPNSQSEAFAKCAGSEVPWSGGFFSTSGNIGVNANSSYPTGDTTHIWNVFMDNSTGTDASFEAYAVCANKPRLYAQSFRTQTVPSGHQNAMAGLCANSQVVTGGGVYSSSLTVYVNLNTTIPYYSTGWISYVNNNSTSTASYDGYAVCVSR